MTEVITPPLEAWIWYIESRLGFVLPKAQHQWLINAINRTAIELHLSTDDLYERVQKDKKLEQSLMDSVLIPETRFFRDMAVVDKVRLLFESHHLRSPFVVMSVGCSTGQEVWSLVMALLHSRPHKRFEVWGVDASQSSLAIAKKGDYPATSFAQIPSRYSYLLDKQEKDIGIKDKLKAYAQFWRCNVFDGGEMRELARHIPKPDVIVCQNMLIYFRRFDQRDILARFESMLGVGGHLILGMGEGMSWQPTSSVRIASPAINAWQKIK